jgi:hypothetical protein
MFASKGMCKPGTTMYCMVVILLILPHSMGIYDRSGFVDVCMILCRNTWILDSKLAHHFNWVQFTMKLRALMADS